MRKKKKAKTKKRVLTIILLVGVLLGLFYYKNRNTLQVVTVLEEIDSYNYQLESNATRIYKKYYKELEEELKDNKIDEKNYASLIAELFVIDYYTLSNKVTNQNIGGVQFIHSNLKDSFISSASSTIYKYVKSNLYGNRRQKLPEVNDVEIESIQEIKYSNGDYQDNSGYQVVVKVGYVNDYNYPTSVTLTIIHEENKLVIVEVK
jgi:hypothetical protein